MDQGFSPKQRKPLFKLTGDSLLTALSVARKCQLVDPEVKMLVVWAELVESTLDAVQHVKIEYMDPDADSVDTGSVPVREYVFALEGRCFDLLQKREPELFLKVVHRGRVFARMLPHQKETLVKTLHKIGRIVGMCGDGCNDLGALRAADVGLSVASSAEKEASIAPVSDTGSVPVREYVFALEGRCFDLLQKREPELFLKVVHRGRVFARMLPHQKETLVKTLHKIGRIVGMCGDGCNDLGALRAADVGLSVASSAEKEASIAAPFTADDDRNLFAAVDIVREGRSTLCSYLGATTFTVAQCYTYMCFIVMVFTSR
ncbi:unnamed protein product [Notodromas monacha]|uniref:Uncharacterized protein n=1 Tax=Notodromas monacha TaxID=399045 RepID=A0A7R9BKN6_9CRUS|nr:unnamed protein product [Notodromas monacha]CAG0916993.1 unnamed protein product [Notodromas monacha]